MNILYIHQYFTTPEEGGGTRSYEFARELVKKGHEVTLITSTHSNSNHSSKKDEYVEGIHVIHLKVPYSNYMNFKRRLFSFISFGIRAIIAGGKVKKCDLLFATSTPLTVAIPGIILSFFKHIPLVFEVRDLWPEVPIQMGVIKNVLLIKVLRWFEKFTYRYSKHIITLSPGMVKGILEIGIKEEKVSLIPNFCNIEFFKPGKPNNSLLKHLNYNDIPIISYAGAISYANNIESIIRTAEKLQKINKKVLFVIAGEGKLKAELEKIAKNNGLKNVIFLGKINKYEVLELYRRSLACLVLFKKLPILTTNSPNKFFDAISTGKPIITNMNGWIGNLIEKYNIGFSIDPSDENSLKNAILKMINMEKMQIRKMETNARNLAIEKFNSKEMVLRLESIFKEATKNE